MAPDVRHVCDSRAALVAEVYVADFGLARAQEAEGQVATTKQNFGPISVRIASSQAIGINVR